MRVADVFAALRLDTTEFQKGLQNLNAEVNKGAKQWGRSLSRFSKSTQQLGRSMTTNLTLPIIGLGAATSKMALDFDKTLSEVVALTSVTRDEIGGIREELLRLAPEVGKGPQELAEAFYFVASAGFEGAEAMEVTRNAAKAAAAGLGDTATVAKVVGSAINAYGRENLTAAQATDTLVAAIGEGSAEAPEFAGALGNVIGSAAQIGASFNDVTAAIAAMTNRGIGAEEAVTALNNVFVSLFKPTTEAQEALAEVGLSAADLRRMIAEEGLLPTLQLLAQRFGGNAEATARVFGNLRSLKAVLALTGGDVEKTTALFGRMQDTVGATGDAFATMAESDSFKLQQAMADLQTVAIELGTDVLPTVVDIARDVADAARGMADAWNGLSDGTKQTIIQWALWIAVAGPVVSLIGKVAGGLATMAKFVTFLTSAKGVPRLVGAMKRMGAGGAAAAGGIGIALVALFGLNEALDELELSLDDSSDSFKEWARSVELTSKGRKEVKDLADELGLSLDTVARRIENFMERTGASVFEAVEAVREGKDRVERSNEEWAASYARLKNAMQAESADIAATVGLTADEFAALPPEVRAALEAGAGDIAAGADAAFDGIDDEAAEARKAALAQMDAMLDSIAALFESDDSLQQAFQDLLDRMDDPYTEAERKADIFSNDLIEIIRGALKSGDPKLVDDTRILVNDLLQQFETLEPGALAAGEGVPKSLRAGMDSQIDGLIRWIEDNIVHDTLLSLTLEEAEQLGLDGIYLYAQGMRFNAALAGLAASEVRREAGRELAASKDDAWRSGFTAGGSYGEGIKSPLNRRGVNSAGRVLAFEAREGVNASLYQTGFNVGKSYGDGLRAAQNYIVTVAGDIRRSVGGHLQFAGSPPYTKSKEYGAGVARSWVEAMVREVRNSASTLTSAFSLAGGAMQPAFAAALPAMAVPTVTPVTPPTAPQATGNTVQYIVNFGGVERVFRDKADFIDFLEDLSAFGDGRVN